MIFERYLLLLNVLHVDWLLRWHQFSSILASAAASRMVSPMCIILGLPIFKLLLVGSVFRTSCVDVWQNISPGNGSSPHSSEGAPIMNLHEASFYIHQCFLVPSTRGGVGNYPLGVIPYRIRISGQVTNVVFCVSLLHYNWHVDIFHREHLWYLRGIFCCWMCCMSTGCWDGTNFHQFWPPLQHQGWYRPCALFWDYPSSNCCW